MRVPIIPSPSLRDRVNGVMAHPPHGRRSWCMDTQVRGTLQAPLMSHMRESPCFSRENVKVKVRTKAARSKVERVFKRTVEICSVGLIFKKQVEIDANLEVSE